MDTWLVWNRMYGFIRKIGPGFITGAADDDPSGVATYSIRWGTVWLQNELDEFVFDSQPWWQFKKCVDRIGLVTGRGLAAVIKKYHSRGLMWFAVVLLAVANTINIGADLGIMAASLQMLLGLTLLFLDLSRGCVGDIFWK